MGTDKEKERAKHWVSHMERGRREPWEKEMGTDKAREREKQRGSREERGMEILWGKGEAP